MNQLLLYGGLCALMPCMAALLYPLTGLVTRTLVYLIAAVQVLIVPVMVALDPAITFGSDIYSLAAGISIVLILAVEGVFVVGTASGLIVANLYLRHREKAAALAQVHEMFLD